MTLDDIRLETFGVDGSCVFRGRVRVCRRREWGCRVAQGVLIVCRVRSLIAKEEANKKGKDGAEGVGDAGGGGGGGGGGGASGTAADGEEEQEFTAEELEEKGMPKAEIRKVLRQQR